MKRWPLYAAFVGAALCAACSGTQQAQETAQANASPSVMPTPSHASMTAAPQTNCGQAGSTLSALDLISGTTFPIGPGNFIWGPNDYIAGFPFGWGSLGNSPIWFLENATTHQKWTVRPVIPFIVGEISQPDHDESTIELIPNVGTASNGVSYQKLIKDYLWHMQYTAIVAQQARRAQWAAELGGAPVSYPTPNPQQSAQDCDFVCPEPSPWGANQTPPPSEQQLLGQIEMGSPPDDSDFQDQPGDPNSQDPHEYDFACRFLNNSPYTLVWRRETRVQEVTSKAYVSVQATLAANSASSQTRGNVGWVAHQFLTYVATSVKPIYAPIPALSPGQGADLKLLQNYQQHGGKPLSWSLVACQDLNPLPTPWPSGAPVPTVTGTCAPPF